MYASVAILVFLSSRLGLFEALRMNINKNSPALQCEQSGKYLPAPGEACASFAGLYLFNVSEPAVRDAYPVPFMIKQSGCNVNVDSTSGNGRGTVDGDTMHFCESDGIGYMKWFSRSAVEVHKIKLEIGGPYLFGQATLTDHSEGTGCEDFSGTWGEYTQHGEGEGQIILTQSGCNVEFGAWGLKGVASGKSIRTHEMLPYAHEMLLYAYSENVLVMNGMAFGSTLRRRPALQCEHNGKDLPAPGKACASFEGLYLLNSSQEDAGSGYPGSKGAYPVPFMVKQSGCNVDVDLLPGSGGGTVDGDTMHFCEINGIGYMKWFSPSAVEVHSTWFGGLSLIGHATLTPPSEGTGCVDFSGIWDHYDSHGDKEGGQSILSQSDCNVEFGEMGLKGVASGKTIRIRIHTHDILLYAYSENMLVANGWFVGTTFRRRSEA